MGTRSRIAVQLENKSFKSVYAHWDGCPDHNGRLLQEHYNSFEKARALVEMGDLSSLYPTIAESHPEDLSKENPPHISMNLATLKKLTQSTCGEWLYVYMAGEWWVEEGGIGFFGDPSSAPPGELELLQTVLDRIPK